MTGENPKIGLYSKSNHRGQKTGVRMEKFKVKCCHKLLKTFLTRKPVYFSHLTHCVPTVCADAFKHIHSALPSNRNLYYVYKLELYLIH